MKKRRFSIIALEFSGIVSALILVIMLLVGTIVLHQQRQVILNQMLARGNYFARSLSAYSKEAFFPEPDLFLLQCSAREMAKEKAVVYVRILDKNRRSLVEIDKQKKGQKEKTKPYDISSPILIKDLQIGTISVGFSQDLINAALASARKKIIIVTLITLIGAIISTIILVTFLVKPINLLAEASRKVGEGDFEQTVSIHSKNEIGMLGKEFNQMTAGLREREFIKGTFKSYVAGPVAEMIMKQKNHIDLKGQKRKVTILFSDIRSFTPLVEKMEAGELVKMLNEYFVLMVDVISKYEGVLDKFIGDSVMAFWNAPLEQADAPQRAVLCGLEMLGKLKGFNAKRIERGDKPILTGIGISMGEVVAGSIGSQKKMEYTVIGDSVNLAARLVGIGKDQVIVDKPTYEEVKNLCQTKSLGMVKVKGKAKELEIFEILGKKT